MKPRVSLHRSGCAQLVACKSRHCHPVLRSHTRRYRSDASKDSSHPSNKSSSSSADHSTKTADGSIKKPNNKNTTSQADEQLRQKFEAMSGEGGVSGIELENGKPVAMKRSVRENMFRYI